MYSNELDLTLTAWPVFPQVVVRIWGGGRGIATQEWDSMLMEERAFPYASPLNFSVNSGPAPEFPPWGYIGLSVHVAPPNINPPAQVSGPVFRSQYFGDSLPTPFPTDPNGLISVLEIDLSGAPFTQAELDKAVTDNFTLPHRLPNQLTVKSLAVTIVDNWLAVIAGGEWIAPGPPIWDGATHKFTYSVNVAPVPSMQMHPDTSQVLDVAAQNNGSLSFDVLPPTSPVFTNTVDDLILNVLAPIFVGSLTHKLTNMLASALQKQVLDKAAALFNLPSGSPLPAGIVLSAERVRIQVQATSSAPAGISAVAAIGSFGPLKNKFQTTGTGGTTCLLTSLASMSLIGRDIDLVKCRMVRDKLATNCAGRSLIGAYYFLSKCIVPWLPISH